MLESVARRTTIPCTTEEEGQTDRQRGNRKKPQKLNRQYFQVKGARLALNPVRLTEAETIHPYYPEAVSVSRAAKSLSLYLSHLTRGLFITAVHRAAYRGGVLGSPRVIVVFLVTEVASSANSATT